MNNTSSECFQEYDEELYMVSRLSSHQFPATIIFPQSLMFWISGVATVVTSGLGIVGNILSLVVLCRKVRDVYWMSKIMLLHLHIWYSDFIKTKIFLCILWYEICIFKYFHFNKICDIQNRQHSNRMRCGGLVSYYKMFVYFVFYNFNLEIALTFQATLHFMESDHYHLSCECLVISDLEISLILCHLLPQSIYLLD